MKKETKKKNQEATVSAIVLVRYLAPVAVLLLSIVSFFIPCMRLTTADTGTMPTLSAAKLLSNVWSGVRQNLFGGNGLSAVNEIFSWTVLAMILVCVLLFLIGAVATVWSTLGALSYLKSKNEQGMARALYVTLFPNRIAACLWQALTLPLLAFPRLLVICYERILYYSVIVNLTFAEPILLGAILYLVLLILCVATRKTELSLGQNPYRKTVRAASEKKEAETTEDNDAEETLFSAASDENENGSEIERRAREEQAERIRQLLQRKDSEE